MHNVDLKIALNSEVKGNMKSCYLLVFTILNEYNCRRRLYFVGFEFSKH